jgi:hypothetical protein
MAAKLGKYDNCTNQRKIEEVYSTDEENIPSNIQMQASINQTSSVSDRNTISSKTTIPFSFFILKQTSEVEKESDQCDRLRGMRWSSLLGTIDNRGVETLVNSIPEAYPSQVSETYSSPSGDLYRCVPEWMGGGTNRCKNPQDFEPILWLWTPQMSAASSNRRELVAVHKAIETFLPALETNQWCRRLFNSTEQISKWPRLFTSHTRYGPL